MRVCGRLDLSSNLRVAVTPSVMRASDEDEIVDIDDSFTARHNVATSHSDHTLASALNCVQTEASKSALAITKPFADQLESIRSAVTHKLDSYNNFFDSITSQLEENFSRKKRKMSGSSCF